MKLSELMVDFAVNTAICNTNKNTAKSFLKKAGIIDVELPTMPYRKSNRLIDIINIDSENVIQNNHGHK